MKRDGTGRRFGFRSVRSVSCRAPYLLEDLTPKMVEGVGFFPPKGRTRSLIELRKGICPFLSMES